MSLSLSLIPLTIALNKTISAQQAAASAEVQHQLKTLTNVETTVNDKNVLKKTLEDFGLPVAVVSENEVYSATSSGTLHYVRLAGEDFFRVSVEGNLSTEKIYDELMVLEKQYGKNVQKYTYDKLVANLKKNKMYVESQYTQSDETIVLTLNIEDSFA